MTREYPIVPFPSGIDRDAFGYWLSGFTDGEGHFGLAWHKQGSGTRPTPRAHFSIKLRHDDCATLRQIQAFWGCGTMHNQTRSPKDHCNAKPQIILKVASTAHLAEIIAPHFERYPLRSKKRRDFAIWKQGVMLLFRASLRPQRWREGRHTADERTRFNVLEATLKEQRRFESA